MSVSGKAHIRNNRRDIPKLKKQDNFGTRFIRSYIIVLSVNCSYFSENEIVKCYLENFGARCTMVGDNVAMCFLILFFEI
jgi:hypothetical protein